MHQTRAERTYEYLFLNNNSILKLFRLQLTSFSVIYFNCSTSFALFCDFSEIFYIASIQRQSGTQFGKQHGCASSYS